MIILLILVAFATLQGISSYYGWPIRPRLGTSETCASRAAYDAFSCFLASGTLCGTETALPNMVHTPLRTGGLMFIGFCIARLVRPPFNDAAVRFFSRSQ